MLLLNCISRILFIKSNLHKNGKEKKDLLKKEDKEIKVKETKIVSKEKSPLRGFFFTKIYNNSCPFL
jgi:hypothetical protein